MQLGPNRSEATKKERSLRNALFHMKNYLLQLDLAADFLDLLLQSLGILLGQTLLHGGGSALDGSLGLGQTQTHDLTDDLDDLDLLSGIEAGQNDVEVGLLLSSGSSSAAALPSRRR